MTENRIDKLEDTVDRIDARTSDILKLLKDDDFGQDGLVTSHNIIKSKVYQQEKRIDRIYWTAGGIAILVSLITAIITVSL